MNINPISRAIKLIGLRPLADACGLKSYQAIRKWELKGLPRTEFTEETAYAKTIEELTDGEISRAGLLDWTRKVKSAA